MTDPSETPPNAATTDLAPEAAPPVPTPEALLDAQFAGPRAALRPLYEALVHVAKRVGSQTKPVPALGFVAFTRKGIPFAVVKVVGKLRMDLGLALEAQTPNPRWKKSRKLAGVERITHRAELYELPDIDGELVQWVKRAYELARPTKPPPAALP